MGQAQPASNKSLPQLKEVGKSTHNTHCCCCCCLYGAQGSIKIVTTENTLQGMKKVEVEKNEANKLEPKDNYRIAYIIHFLLGAGNLLPWNAFITAVDYFSYVYPGRHVEKVFSVAYMSSSVLVLVLLMSLGSLNGKLNIRLRMNIGISMFILTLMVTPIIDWSISGRTKSDEAFYVTAASVVVCGIADGLVGGSLIGSAGKLPKQYMQAVFAGTASSGLLVSILRIITKASLPRTPQGLRTSAHFYFIVSTTILVCCMIFSNLLYKLRVMQQYHSFLDQQESSQTTKAKFWVVTRKVRWPVFGVFVMYTVTLSIFPGFIADNLESRLLQDWYPVLLITTYNLADLVGKSLTAVYIIQSIKKTIWGSIARLVFYPMFAACLHGPKWLKREVPVVALTFMLGLTNGYLTSVLMILAPKTVPPSEAELSAIVMLVFLGFGLVTGSLVGWFWII